MKMRIRNPFLLRTLAAGLGLMRAGPATAQAFTNLHGFTALVSSTNSDGANPHDGLLLPGSTLHGAAFGGTEMA